MKALRRWMSSATGSAPRAARATPTPTTSSTHRRMQAIRPRSEPASKRASPSGTAWGTRRAASAASSTEHPNDLLRLRHRLDRPARPVDTHEVSVRLSGRLPMGQGVTHFLKRGVATEQPQPHRRIRRQRWSVAVPLPCVLHLLVDRPTTTLPRRVALCVECVLQQGTGRGNGPGRKVGTAPRPDPTIPTRRSS